MFNVGLNMHKLYLILSLVMLYWVRVLLSFSGLQPEKQVIIHFYSFSLSYRADLQQMWDLFE